MWDFGNTDAYKERKSSVWQGAYKYDPRQSSTDSISVRRIRRFNNSSLVPTFSVELKFTGATIFPIRSLFSACTSRSLRLLKNLVNALNAYDSVTALLFAEAKPVAISVLKHIFRLNALPSLNQISQVINVITAETITPPEARNVQSSSGRRTSGKSWPMTISHTKKPKTH